MRSQAGPSGLPPGAVEPAAHGGDGSARNGEDERVILSRVERPRDGIAAPRETKRAGAARDGKRAGVDFAAHATRLAEMN